MADRPDPVAPIFEEEVAVAVTRPATTGASGLAFAALLFGNVVLACGPWLVRLADVGPVSSGFWRLAIAIPFLVLIAGRTDKSTARPGGGLLLVAVAGIFFALDLAAWHAGILRTRLANAALFGNVSSFFFATYGFIMARALPDRRQTTALLLAGCGIMLLLGRSYELSAANLVGDGLCMLAGLAYAGYMIAIDRVRGRLGTWPTLAIATIAAALTLLPMALILEGSIWPHRWAPLVALAIGSQVIGQGLLIWTIRVMPPLVVGLGQLTQPVIGAAIGCLIFGEMLTLTDLMGAAAIGSALILMRRR